MFICIYLMWLSCLPYFFAYFQIGTAITFLQNAGVKRNPLNQKQQFLRTKGLTEDEIQIACERAGVYTGEPQHQASASASGGTVINMGITSPSPASGGGGSQYLRHHDHGAAPASTSFLAVGNKSLLQHVRDVVSASALVAGVAYAVYMFYKVCRSREHCIALVDCLWRRGRTYTWLI